MTAADLIYMGLILLIGLLLGKLFLRFNLPHITGYLVAGLLLGPAILNIIPESVVGSLGIFSSIVLTFVAFSIGSEFNLKYLKKLGSKPFVLAICISIITFIVVSTSLYIAGMDIKVALLLAAIATPTSPVAIIVIVNHYRAKGPLTRTLLEIVAIDDVIAILIYGLTISVVKSMAGTDVTVINNIILSFSEIVLSIIIGAVLGCSEYRLC